VRKVRNVRTSVKFCHREPRTCGSSLDSDQIVGTDSATYVGSRMSVVADLCKVWHLPAGIYA
jgi:hypothetical protein